MAFTPVGRMQIKNAIERVLHVPGNYNGGTLEMAIVFDSNLSKETAIQMGKDIAGLLKSHSEVFRNVRLNGILWEHDEVLVKDMTSLPHLQMGRYLEDYQCVKQEKKLELLMAQLKKFYARSKIILLFTDGNYRIGDEVLYKESMHPFLYRKLVILQCSDEMAGNMAADDTAWSISVHTGTELLKM